MQRTTNGLESKPPPIIRSEAARRLGLDQVTNNADEIVRKMIRRGELRGVWVSKYLLVDPVSVEEYLAAGG